MAAVGENRQQDLVQLETFVQNPKLTGFVNHLWYSYLRFYYPLEFIRLVNKYEKCDAWHISLHQEAIKKFNELFATFNTFLVIAPKTGKEKQEFNKATKRLEKLISVQIKYN